MGSTQMDLQQKVLYEIKCISQSWQNILEHCVLFLFVSVVKIWMPFHCSTLQLCWCVNIYFSFLSERNRCEAKIASGVLEDEQLISGVFFTIASQNVKRKNLTEKKLLFGHIYTKIMRFLYNFFFVITNKLTFSGKQTFFFRHLSRLYNISFKPCTQPSIRWSSSFAFISLIAWESPKLTLWLLSILHWWPSVACSCAKVMWRTSIHQKSYSCFTTTKQQSSRLVVTGIGESGALWAVLHIFHFGAKVYKFLVFHWQQHTFYILKSNY